MCPTIAAVKVAFDYPTRVAQIKTTINTAFSKPFKSTAKGCAFQ